MAAFLFQHTDYDLRSHEGIVKRNLFQQTLSAGKLVFHSPLNHSILVPAIHRGQYPPPESFSYVETAHGVTKLTHRRHKPLLEHITQRIVAHGELQRNI